MSFLRRHRQDPPEAHAIDPSIVAIADAQARQRIRISGQVTRMRARPTSGQPALAVTISDGTGSVTALWTGRRAIGGISLGRQLVIEGAAIRKGEQLEFTNPAYTLLT